MVILSSRSLIAPGRSRVAPPSSVISWKMVGFVSSIWYCCLPQWGQSLTFFAFVSISFAISSFIVGVNSVMFWSLTPVGVELLLGEEDPAASPAGRLDHLVDVGDERHVEDGLGQLDVPKVARAPRRRVPARPALLSWLEGPEPRVHQAALDGHPVLVVGLGLGYLRDRVLS